MSRRPPAVHSDDATRQADAERRRDQRRERLLILKALGALALVAAAIAARMISM